MKLYVLDIGSYNGRYTLCVLAQSPEKAVRLMQDKINEESYKGVVLDYTESVWFGIQEVSRVAPRPDKLTPDDLGVFELEEVVEIDNLR